MNIKDSEAFKDALKASVAIPVTPEAVYALRQQIVRLEEEVTRLEQRDREFTTMFIEIHESLLGEGIVGDTTGEVVSRLVAEVWRLRTLAGFEH